MYWLKQISVLIGLNIMTRLSRNLLRHEMACKCGCGFNTADVELVGAVQECVDHFQALDPNAVIKLHVNSGSRCPKYNATIPGASDDSQHLYGRALDFYLYDKANDNKRIDPNDVADYLEKQYPTKYGVGRYSGWVHFDTKTGVARRWDRR